MTAEPRRRRAPCIDMRTDVQKDERFSALADNAGLVNKYEAIGRMHALWSWCMDRGLRDAPDDCDGYAVSDAVARRFLGPRAVEGLLADGCDELALAVRRDDGLLYLRGTGDTVAQRRHLASAARAGGEARASAPRENGRFVGETTNIQPQASHDSSQTSSPEPAGTSDLPSSSFPLPLPSSNSEKNSATPSAGGSRSRRVKPSDVTESERAAALVVLEKLGKRNGVRYTGTAEHIRLIARHLRDGVTEMDLRFVVGYCAESLGWEDDPAMAKFLRPETLFGPKTLSKYLDPARAWAAPQVRQQPQNPEGNA